MTVEDQAEKNMANGLSERRLDTDAKRPYMMTKLVFARVG